VSGFGQADPPRTTSRVLRRLAHSPAVTTAYLSRNSELESLEADCAAAVRRGYDDGYAEGLARAAADAAGERDKESARAAAALSALQRVIAAAEEANVRMRGEIQAAAPKLAFALLETLLGREVALAANPGLEAVTRVLALDEGGQPATVRLNPTEVDVLGDVDLGRVVSVVADPAVEPGGALVEIGKSTLDAQLGPALERVRQVLVGPTDPQVVDDRAA
jgi:flagellar assembly protein FliH